MDANASVRARKIKKKISKVECKLDSASPKIDDSSFQTMLQALKNTDTGSKARKKTPRVSRKRSVPIVQALSDSTVVQTCSAPKSCSGDDNNNKSGASAKVLSI